MGGNWSPESSKTRPRHVKAGPQNATRGRRAAAIATPATRTRGQIEPRRAQLVDWRCEKPRPPKLRRAEQEVAESITGWWSRPPTHATRFEKARFSEASPRRAQAIDSINLITEREPPEAANRSKLDHRNGRDGERSPNTRGALEHGWTRVERASPSSGARNHERRTAAKSIREERNRSQDGGRDRRLTRRVLKKRASREGRRDERKRSIRST